jgi:S1-C subfamily serine protease
VVPAVVALRVAATRPFDTEASAVVAATGFVVDAQRGLILTNRHVVHPGPVTAEAVFLDHEKVDVQPVYRDPVHDFGFFRFDPALVRFMEPGELALAPAAAQVGVEVRIVGNDAGEKISILDGTLARLDRDAPEYGPGRYNDFDTFYLQAASSSSGGSSGSPVVDRAGRVVGLVAGGSRGSAASFFLPLDRVVRALELLRAGRPVPRGTLQAVFRHRAYDELRRLGLRPASEEAARRAFPGGVGLLVVDEVVPDGPAAGRLEPGDVLLRLAGRPVAGFASLEARLDDAVGEEIAVEVERGGEPVALRLRVGDLHAITPAEYLEAGGAVLHPLSFQQARNYGVPVAGVALTAPGYAFGRAGIPGRSVVTHLDGEPVPDLDAFEAALARHADGARLRVRFFPLANPRSPLVEVARVDRRFYPMQRCRRDDTSGLWPCRPSPEPPAAEPPAPATARLDVAGPSAARRLARSLVLVDFDVPFLVDGVQGTSFTGAGLVVDAEAGLVVVDRDTVPIPIGDVELTFGGAVQVPAEVVALHPDHNLALVRYEPARLGATPVDSAVLGAEPVAAGEELWLVSMTPRQLVARETRVAGVDAASLPLPRVPRFRETNVELVSVTEPVEGVGGVLADGKGRVRALWASFSRDEDGKPGSFFAGLPIELVEEWLAPLRRGEALAWRSAGAELELLTLAAARARGLPEDEARGLEERAPLRPRVLAVRRLEAGTAAAERLRVGDLLLAVGGEPAVAFRDLERAAQAGDGEVALRVLRDGRVRDLALPTVTHGGAGTRRIVGWAGALLQEPSRELARQRGLVREGVYVAGRWRGSPADRHDLDATSRITAVDGRSTPDLEAFLAAVAGGAHRDSVRLRVLDLEGRSSVIPLELDLHYWPTVELRDGPGGWQRIHHSH